MSKFLNDFLITMPDTQRKMLIDLLNQRKNQGYIISEEDFEREIMRLIGNLEEHNGTPTFQAIKQKERLNSQSYNQNLDAISFDLSTIFESSNTVERLLGSHQQLSRSALSDLRKRISDMRSQVKYFQLLLRDGGSTNKSIYEYFHSPVLIETNQSLLNLFRRDRFGELRSDIYDAENVGGTLQLSSIQSSDQLKTNYGRSIAKIKVRNRIGLEAEETKFPIELAIDGSPNTFWAESVLVDDTIIQNIDDIWSSDYHDYPKSGALCEVEIELNGLSTVSELRFDPYASYPLEVVSIYGYENKNRTGEVYDLISPIHENAHQRSQKSVDLMTFQFPSVEVSLIRILIRQENYTKENFIVSEDDLQESNMWDELTSNEYVIPDYKEPGETIASFDRKNEISGWNFYLEKLKEWATIFRQEGLTEAAKRAMEVIKIGDYKNPLLLSLYAMDQKGDKQRVHDERSPHLKNVWKPINKLSYVYGAYDIAVYGRKYHRSSISITEELPLSSNTKYIGLTTEERHHYISIGPDEVDPTTNAPRVNSSKITDIEYYITNKKNPIPNDWIPILPSNHSYVEGELLLGDDDTEACPILEEGNTINFSLRFPFISKDTIVIRRNGVPMNPSMYLLCDNEKKIGIKNEHYSPTSIYTIDYKTSKDAYQINVEDNLDVSPTPFISSKGEAGEYFSEANQNNKVELSFMPYLHRDFLYSYHSGEERYHENPSTLNASSMTYPLIVRVNGKEFKNITNYTTNSFNEERLKENSGQTFAHIGNEIIFGRPIDNSPIENITVDYYYMTTSLRMKTILRRNHAGYESITPALLNYNIKSQSYDQEF